MLTVNNPLGLIMVSIESIMDNDHVEQQITNNVKLFRRKDAIFEKPKRYAISYVKSYFLENFQIIYFTNKQYKMVDHYRKWLDLNNFPRSFSIENSNDYKLEHAVKVDIFNRFMNDFAKKYENRIYVIDDLEWFNWWNSYNVKLVPSSILSNLKNISKNIDVLYNELNQDENYLKRLPIFLDRSSKDIERESKDITRCPKLIVRNAKVK